jgi:hypothetical protein
MTGGDNFSIFRVLRYKIEMVLHYLFLLERSSVPGANSYFSLRPAIKVLTFQSIVYSGRLLNLEAS